MSFRQTRFTFLLFFILEGCGSRTPAVPQRYAVARFENLSGDPSLDWVARAVAESLSRTLAHALDGPVLFPSALIRAGAAVSDDRSKAQLAGATRLISGYVERVGDQLRLTATDEDLNTHSALRRVSAQASKPLPAIEQLSHGFSARAAGAITSNEEVLKLYSSSLDGPLDRIVSGLEQAVHIEPSFGPAWVTLIEATTLKGDRAAALAKIDSALSRKLDPFDAATIRLHKANIENDRTAKVTALRELTAASPGDLPLLRSLAADEAVTGQFAQSAADWRKLTGEVPSDREAWNQMGYSLAWAGDFAGAMTVMKEYAARWPDDPNPLDSTGDVAYMYGKFVDAANFYLKAAQKDPRFLDGGCLLKAAWAQYQAGDKNADNTFARFKSARTKMSRSDFALFEGDWLYRTGRKSQAISLVRADAATANAADASGLWSQLIIWDLLSGDRPAAPKNAAIDATKPPSNVSVIARFSALPSVPAPEWVKRSETLLGGGTVEAARRYALGVALLLDGRNDAARPLWEKISQSVPANDFFVQTLYEKLKGGKPTLELVPDPLAVNQLRALADKPLR